MAGSVSRAAGERLSSRERLLVIVEKLAGKPVEGMGNKALAAELGSIEANICRDLKILDGRGWIEKTNGGKWRMSAKFGGFAGTIIKGFKEAKLRLTEDEARYASEMQ